MSRANQTYKVPLILRIANQRLMMGGLIKCLFEVVTVPLLVLT